jgi:hypothetical protein
MSSQHSGVQGTVVKTLGMFGALVLIALTLGSASAHHGQITSGEIQDRTIKSRDQKTGSTDGRVIEDGSIDGSEIAGPTKTRFIVPASVPSGRTIRGAIGADYHVYSEASDDVGINVSLPIPARTALSDDDVHVNVSLWETGDGQSQPTTTDTNAGCDGTLGQPTAPAGDVCIYVAGGDNAQNLSGFSVRPGTDASRFGFKLKWDPPNTGDTFIDGVWAYTAE